MDRSIKETREFTGNDLEPLTKDQVIHLLYARVTGFDGMERTIKWQHGDSCSECNAIASRLIGVGPTNSEYGGARRWIDLKR